MTDRIDTILAAARRHCNEVIRPEVDQWNAMGKWPRHASDQAAALGLTGLYCPEELGGQGLSLGDGIRVYEELGKGDGAYAFALSMHNICSYAVCGFGTDAFKKKWARDLTAGRKLANFALTEPQSGSDASIMYSRARINGDGTWTISGAKAWVSLAGVADVYLTVVKTSDVPGHTDMAMIAIRRKPRGSASVRAMRRPPIISCRCPRCISLMSPCRRKTSSCQWARGCRARSWPSTSRVFPSLRVAAG